MYHPGLLRHAETDGWSNEQRAGGRLVSVYVVVESPRVPVNALRENDLEDIRGVPRRIKEELESFFVTSTAF
jgi:hypothetical protein